MVQDDGHNEVPPDSSHLRLLLIEDNPDDAELCRLALNKLPQKPHLDVVSTKEDFRDRLRAASYDIILSDYSLGNWNAADALNFLRSESWDIPFILVTGTLGEEKAVACIKSGMAEFILKGHLDRLPIAISRCLEEKRLQDEYRRAQRSIRESEAKFRALADAIPAAIFIEEGGVCRYANHTAVEITGYSQEELLAMTISRIVHPDSKQEAAEHQAKREKSPRSADRFEIKIQPKASEPRWLDVTIGTLTNEGMPATLTTAFDITERKRLHREIQNDVITGLPNRQHLIDIFEIEASRTRRTGRAFSVLLLFLEKMDQMVHIHGKLAATQALRHAARTTRLHCRNLDTIGRIAADQFAIVLPETDTAGAQVLGNRIVGRLSSPIQEHPLSCKFAAASYPGDGNTLEEVLKAADRQILSTLQR